jgi:hypothetical protein
MGRTLLLMVAAAVGVAACADRGAAPNATVGTATASAPGFTRPAAGATDSAGGTADAAPAPSAGGAAGVAASSDAPSADAGSAAAGASSAASAAALPEVEIATYGMHVGGGPNDNKTKAPIRDAIMARRDAFRACFALAEDQTKTGTFGVDLRIPGSGGRAEVSKLRPGLKGAGVDECVVRAFESVAFQKPPKGVPMVVSCSLRFTPKRGI